MLAVRLARQSTKPSVLHNDRSNAASAQSRFDSRDIPRTIPSPSLARIISAGLEYHNPSAFGNRGI